MGCSLRHTKCTIAGKNWWGVAALTWKSRNLHAGPGRLNGESCGGPHLEADLEAKRVRYRGCTGRIGSGEWQDRLLVDLLLWFLGELGRVSRGSLGVVTGLGRPFGRFGSASPLGVASSPSCCIGRQNAYQNPLFHSGTAAGSGSRIL
jgi:hypothetical protein